MRFNRCSQVCERLAPRSLCSIDDVSDAPDEGGGDTTPVAASDVPQPVITPAVQALIDNAAKRAHDAGAAAARRAIEQRQKSNVTRTDAAPANGPTVDIAAMLARQTAFTRAVGRYELSDEAFDLVQEEFGRSGDDDVAGWVTRRATAFGWRSTGRQATQQPSGVTAGHTAANGSVAPMLGTSPPARVVTEDTPIIDMSIADRIALRNQIGVFRFASRLKSEQRNDPRLYSLRK